MKLRPDCGALPWLAAAVGIFGVAGRFFLPAPTSWTLTVAWQHYLFFGVISALLLGLAYLGWQCHLERQLPSPPLRKLLVHLAKLDGFSGTPSQYNKEAQRVLYGDNFSSYLPEPSDYYSSLMSSGFVEVTSATDHGNKPDGTPDLTVSIALTDKAIKIVRSLPQE